MLQYEIRIFTAASAAVIIEAFHVSDAHAIRIAAQLANGRMVEVWRDVECIHRAPARPSGAQAHAA